MSSDCNHGRVGPKAGRPGLSGNSIVLEAAAIVLDVNNIENAAAFWGAMLGEEPGPLRAEGGWITIGSLDSTIYLTLQKVPEPKIGKNRCHICLVVPDVDEAVLQVLSKGAAL